MPDPTCSNCGKQGRYLRHVATFAAVYYYRCEACGQVWVVDALALVNATRIVSPADKPLSRHP